MLNYDRLSEQITQQIERDRSAGRSRMLAFDEAQAVRRNADRDRASVLRPPFIRDIEKILHCPYYNRYTDKTQVFSFYKNDDITRRALHVQLVSRIARNLGRALGLNEDLIEAIALGHDIGHTPFGHAGEEYLDEVLFQHIGRHFSHNVHSVRVLDGIYPYNITLQTLNGIAAHDGEFEAKEYHPVLLTDFTLFDRQIEACYADKTNVRKLIPCTLEGCVVRIADIIAYLGKDRQDAERAGVTSHAQFREAKIGRVNAEIINNLIVSIVENSYGKGYISMSDECFEALQTAKADNYQLIYKNKAVRERLETTVRPMMWQLFERLLLDLAHNRTESPIFSQHIGYVKKAHYHRGTPYEQDEPSQIVVDYLASMTDDYFVDLYARLFPDSPFRIEYTGYFDD